MIGLCPFASRPAGSRHILTSCARKRVRTTPRPLGPPTGCPKFEQSIAWGAGTGVTRAPCAGGTRRAQRRQPRPCPQARHEPRPDDHGAPTPGAATPWTLSRPSAVGPSPSAEPASEGFGPLERKGPATPGSSSSIPTCSRGKRSRHRRWVVARPRAAREPGSHPPLPSLAAAFPAPIAAPSLRAMISGFGSLHA